MNKNLTLGNSKIASLFDEGTFVEIGAYIKRCGCADNYDGVICGYGSISGKLAFAFLQDSDRLKGAFDKTGAKKIAMLYDMAIKNGAAIIGVFDSAGAVVLDGSAALTAYGKLISNVSSASGIVPQIAVVNGPCTGLSLVAATMFDFVIAADDKAKTYITSDSTAKKNIPVAIHADGENSAFAAARELVDILPQNNNDTSCAVTEDGANRTVSVDGLSGKALVQAICDNGKYTELYTDNGNEISTGFAFFGGHLCGVVASDSTQNGGKLTCKGVEKAAALVSFCDRFSINLLTLVDCEGFSDKCCAPSAATLASAYAGSTGAKITVVTGNAYGAGFTLLGSKALGADIELALDGAVISVMSPESAVAFLMNDKITADKSRADVENEWREEYASPVRAAEKGDIDDIIDPAELRARICAAVYMLATKADGNPTRKHFKM